MLSQGNDAAGLALTNLATPLAADDAATKAYVDTHSCDDIKEERGTFDVKCLGAIGNGIHDDTVMIMNAIDEAEDWFNFTNATPTLLFPPGLYKVANTLEINLLV